MLRNDGNSSATNCKWLMAAVLIVLFIAGDAFAQGAGAWPAMDTLRRGPGYYLSLGKILACWFVFLAWVFSTDQINR